MKSIDDDVSLTVADVSKPVLIRVYVGTSNSPHDAAFRLAWKEMKPIMENKLQTVMFAEPECLCMEQVISLEMNMEDLVNWLLNSDVHFILGNIHQGYAKHNCSIDLRDVQCQLQRLEFHNGFPSGDLLSCPVFTQDKAKYLKLLGFGEMCNPTMFIDLVDDGVFEDSVIAAVQRSIIYNISCSISFTSRLVQYLCLDSVRSIQRELATLSRPPLSQEPHIPVF